MYVGKRTLRRVDVGETRFDSLDHVVSDILEKQHSTSADACGRSRGHGPRTHLSLPLGSCPERYDRHLDTTSRQGLSPCRGTRVGRADLSAIVELDRSERHGGSSVEQGKTG